MGKHEERRRARPGAAGAVSTAPSVTAPVAAIPANVMRPAAFGSPMDWFTFAAVTVAVLNLARFLAAFPGVLPSDDSYIVLDIARNIAHGGIFEYNAGEPCTGITSPLYALVLAGLNAVLQNWHASVLFAGVCACLLILWAGYRLAVAVGGRLAGVLWILLFGSSGRLAFHAFMGLEAIFFDGMVLTAVWFFLQRRHLLTGYAAGAAYLVRPEAILFAPVFGICLLIELRRQPRGVRLTERLRTCLPAYLWLAVGFLFLALPWIVYCLHVSGTFLPSTAVWKSAAFEWSGCIRFLGEILRMDFAQPYEYNVVLAHVPPPRFTALCVCAPWFLLVGVAAAVLLRPCRALTLLLFMVVHVLSLACAHRDADQWDRYASIEYAGLLLYAAMIAAVAAQRLAAFLRARAKPMLAACASTLLLLAIVAPVVVVQNARYVFHIQGYQTRASYFYHLDYVIGLWLKQNTPPNTVLAVYQAGGPKFFGECRVIDLGGVAHDQTKPYIRAGMCGKAIVDFNVDYVAAFGDDWMASEGIRMSDTNLFERVPLDCRASTASARTLSASSRRSDTVTAATSVRVTGAAHNSCRYFFTLLCNFLIASYSANSAASFCFLACPHTKVSLGFRSTARSHWSTASGGEDAFFDKYMDITSFLPFAKIFRMVLGKTF